MKYTVLVFLKIFILLQINCDVPYLNQVPSIVEKSSKFFDYTSNQFLNLNNPKLEKLFDKKNFDEEYYSKKEIEENVKSILKFKKNYGKFISKEKSGSSGFSYDPKKLVHFHYNMYLVKYEKITNMEIFVYRSFKAQNFKLFAYQIKSLDKKKM